MMLSPLSWGNSTHLLEEYMGSRRSAVLTGEAHAGADADVPVLSRGAKRRAGFRQLHAEGCTHGKFTRKAFDVPLSTILQNVSIQYHANPLARQPGCAGRSPKLAVRSRLDLFRVRARFGWCGQWCG